MSQDFATLAEAVRHGMTLTYVAALEGIPALYAEDSAFASASVPSGWGSIDACLLVAEGQEIGSEVDRQSGFGRGFDAVLGFYHELSSTVPGYVARPSASSRLTTDLAFGETSTINVEDTSDFPSSGDLFIGRETIGYTGKTSTTFTGLTRGKYGSKARDHSGGGPLAASATDSPVFWKGRRVSLYAVPVDGWGVIQGSDLLADAALIWKGYVTGRGFDMSESGHWQLECRSLDRLLEEPFAAELSGKIVVDPHPDPLCYVQADAPDAVTAFYLFASDGGEYFENEWQPLVNLTGDASYRASEIRAAISASWAALADKPSWVGDLTWEPVWNDDSFTIGTWRMRVAIDFDDLNDPNLAGVAHAWWNAPSHPYQESVWADVTATNGAGIVFVADLDNGGVSGGFQQPDKQTFNSGSTAVDLGVQYLTGFLEVRTTTMHRVVLDEGELTEIPDEGWIFVEHDLQEQTFQTVIQFQNKLTSPEGDAVWVQLLPHTTREYEAVKAIWNEAEGLDVSIAQPLGWTSPIDAADMIRHILLSSGRGNNHGTYDDPDICRVGYDLDSADVNLGSFAALQGGAWAPMKYQTAITEETTLGDLVSGLLAVSSHALVMQPGGTGAALRFTPVDVGLPVTAPDIVDLDDTHIVMSGGQSNPVRPIKTREWPNKVTIETSKGTTADRKREGRFTARDPDRIENEGPSEWEYEIQGLDALEVRPSFTGWIYDMFMVGAGAQICEVDVVPWLDVRIGSLLNVSISHYALFSRSTGQRGYTGLGRVLGYKLGLTSGVVTLLVLLDADLQAMALSPSAQVDSWDGTASDPTEIYLPDSYDEVFSAIGPGLFVVYLPGGDGTDTAVVEVSAITNVGGGLIRLTVESTTGSVTLTTSHHLTLPVSASATAAQLLYLHTDSAAWWT